jgi:hypothetical protein
VLKASGAQDAEREEEKVGMYYQVAVTEWLLT